MFRTGDGCRFRFSLLAGLLFTTAPSTGQQPPPSVARESVQPVQSGTQIFRTYAPTIAVIEATDDTAKVLRFGSGVFLAEQRVLVTNAHVVSGPGRIRARLGSVTYSAPEIEVLYVDSESDLAVLKLSRPARTTASAAARSSGTIASAAS